VKESVIVKSCLSRVGEMVCMVHHGAGARNHDI